MKLNKVFPIVVLLLIGLMSGCDKDDEPQGELPQVTSTDPLNEAVDVDISTLVTAEFSVEMDPSTINTSTFILKHGATDVTGTVSYSGTTATFTPIYPLMLDTEYTAFFVSGFFTRSYLLNALKCKPTRD